MANIRAEQKRSLLQWIFDGVRLDTLTADLGIQLALNEPSPIVSFEDGLIWFQRFIGNDVKSGKFTTGTSGFGHTVQFAKPEVWRPFAQDELLSLAQEFREVYNDALVTLTGGPTDDRTILATMMADDRLQTVTVTHSDFTTLRWPWTRVS